MFWKGTSCKTVTFQSKISQAEVSAEGLVRTHLWNLQTRCPVKKGNNVLTQYLRKKAQDFVTFQVHGKKEDKMLN